MVGINFSIDTKKYHNMYYVTLLRNGNDLLGACQLLCFPSRDTSRGNFQNFRENIKLQSFEV